MRVQNFGTQIARLDRATLFLGCLLFLFFWDAAYFLGIRDPVRLPHPFILFRSLGDIESLRGASRNASGIILLLRIWSDSRHWRRSTYLLNAQLIKPISRFLRLVVWWPLFIGFFGAGVFFAETMTAILSACYHYVQGRAVLGLERRDSWVYAAREALLQTLLVTLIAQLWVSRWQWSVFTVLMQIRPGFEAFITLVALIGLINWCFRATFEKTAKRHAAIMNYLLESEDWKAANEFILLAIPCLLTWELLSTLGFTTLVVSPTQGFNAIYNLLLNGEMWGDIGFSLLEIMAGLVFAGLIAEIVFLASGNAILRKILFPLLSVTYISFIVLWLIVFVIALTSFEMKGSSFLSFWHKAIAVMCLSFFPFVEALWGFRERPAVYRLIIAIDAALPIAFVAMLFGEAYAATKGLGFSIIVSRLTGQGEKAVGLTLITFALLVGLSFTLRWAAKSFSTMAKTPESPSVC